jgi:H+-translocating NAD(P) transhydrogenase subunit alpha
VIAASGPGLMPFITVFVLAAFVGYEVISKVPSILHTPLMSGSNAIHGIILVGAMLVLGEAHGTAQLVLGFMAVVLATLNVVGGFVVTDRMLEMFKPRQSGPPQSGSKPSGSSANGPSSSSSGSAGAGSAGAGSAGAGPAGEGPAGEGAVGTGAGAGATPAGGQDGGANQPGTQP